MQNMNKAQQGQSFIDMVYQETGSFEGIVEAAVLSGKSITEDIEIGEIILTEKVVNSSMKNILQKRKPATGVSHTGNQTNQLQGIDYWIIGTDFIVN